MKHEEKSWTFLSNHAHILILIAANPQMRMRELALHTAITERAVQRIVADLHKAGYLSLERQGRRNHYEVHTDLPMRHPIERHCPVSNLLDGILDCRPVNTEVSVLDQD